MDLYRQRLVRELSDLRVREQQLLDRLALPSVAMGQTQHELSMVRGRQSGVLRALELLDETVPTVAAAV